MRKIVDVFNGQIERPGYSRLVRLAEIESHDYNLNLPRYIDSAEVEDVQDIEAHLRGGIPERDIEQLARYWEVLPTLRAHLFAEARPGYSALRVSQEQIRPAILAHPEFVAYTRTVNAALETWQAKHRPRLQDLAVGSQPRPLIEALAEDLLRAFSASVETQNFASLPALINKYDVYQHLMSYWTETLQDDVYLIAAEGWLEANKPRLLEAKSKEQADLQIGKLKYKADLIPPALIVARYFAAAQQAIEALQAEKDDLGRQLQELQEEHGGEEGLLQEVKNDKGNISKGNVTARLKELIMDNGRGTMADDDADERALLRVYLDLMEREAQAGHRLREAQRALEAQVAAQYEALSEEEVKTLVVDDKWLPDLSAAVQSELERVSQALSGRVKELAERYAVPLPAITGEVEALSDKVDAHLEGMGFVWK
jgi:type I restriction enzyme M protein